MKYFSDRNTINLITKIGIMLAIVTECTAVTERFRWTIPLAILVSILVSSIIFGLKSYRNLVFKDEQYSGKADEGSRIGANIGVNILALILFFLGYMISNVLFYYLTDDLNCDLKWSTWALVVNTVYFGSAFVFFINKIRMNT